MDSKETTELITDYGGSYVVWAHCKNCGQTVQYPTDNPYNVCPYCKLTILWQE